VAPPPLALARRRGDAARPSGASRGPPALDNNDRVASRTDPLTHGASYDYDLNGNLTQVVDRESQVARYTYDELDRRHAQRPTPACLAAVRIGPSLHANTSLRRAANSRYAAS
jgi:YD repeat-containing protein